MDFGGNRIKSGIPTKVNMGDSGSDSTQNTVVREFISAYFKPQVKPHRERLDWLITLWMELCWAPLDISCFKISWDCNVWASLCERVGLWNSGLVTPTTHAHTLLKKNPFEGIWKVHESQMAPRKRSVLLATPSLLHLLYIFLADIASASGGEWSYFNTSTVSLFPPVR